MRDILTLLKDLPIGSEDRPGVLNLAYIGETCARDWGLYHTVSRNVHNMARYMADYPLDREEQTKVSERLKQLQRALETTPKSWRWQLRALFGERLRWYQEVEGQG